MGQFFEELKRRNVFRVGIAYLIAAWLLIQIVETLFPIFGLSDALIRLVAILLFIGFPIILIFSWAYELTPEGLKLERDVDRSRSVVHHTGRKLDRAIIVVLALSLGYFAFDKFVLDPARDAEREETVVKQARSEALVESYGDKSIAVLPFVNMSDDAGNEYFSDGISEELLNLLSKISQLRVISRSSSFSFKGKGIAIPAIAEQLNVAHILEGSVRKVGKRVRITAQLIDARSDTHLWSSTYDRNLDDVFAIQDEISAAIVEALKDSLGLKIDAAPRVIAAANTAAHEALLRGRYLVVQRTSDTVGSAAREFEKAVALDPDYALAHAELAMAILLQTRGNYGDLDRPEAIDRATSHVQQAMTLDPTLAEAHAAKGFLSSMRLNPEEALTHYQHAIELNPNYSIVYNWLGLLFNELGRYDEELATYEKSLALDPLSTPAITSYLVALIDRNRLVDADREIEKLASLHPFWYANFRGMRRSVGGKWANALLGRLDALRISPEHFVTRLVLTWEFAAIGLEKEALAISDFSFHYTQTFLGKPEDAVKVAEELYAADPSDALARRDLGRALAGAGDYVRARPILEEWWHRSGERVTLLVTRFMIIDAAALIAARRAAGEEAGIGELLAAIRDNVRRAREAGITRANQLFSVDFEEGFAAYLAGERKKGLELIAKGAEDGYFILPNESCLQVLYDDPGFAPIRARQEARQVRERNRFLAIVCTDNPYEAVWQPAEGTCERYAGAANN
jgi:TolB-like protein/Tfp pilus assembly protein PilF